MLTWTNKAFQMCKTQSGFMAHGVDGQGVIVFRWRMYYDEKMYNELTYHGEILYEDFTVPFGVIEHFETFKALCRQFDTPGDAEAWYNKRIKENGR